MTFLPLSQAPLPNASRIVLIPLEQCKEWEWNVNVAFTWCLFLALGFGIYFIWVVTNWCHASTSNLYRAVFSTLLQQGLFLQLRNAAKCSKPRKKNHHLPSKSPEIIPAMCQLNQQSIIFLLRSFTGIQEAENPRGAWIWFSFWAVGAVHTDISDYCTYYRWHVQEFKGSFPPPAEWEYMIWHFPHIHISLCTTEKHFKLPLFFFWDTKYCSEMLSRKVGDAFSLEVSTAMLEGAWSHLL